MAKYSMKVSRHPEIAGGQKRSSSRGISALTAGAPNSLSLRLSNVRNGWLQSTSMSSSTYRGVVRELYKSVSDADLVYGCTAYLVQSVSSRATRNKTIASNFRALFERPRTEEESERFNHDIENALTFMHSQRMHKVRVALAIMASSPN